MVVTTVLILPAFSLSTASLEAIESVASIIWCIVLSMLVSEERPALALSEVFQATSVTSCMVLTSSLDVAVISVTVVLI
jgi:hypothetical protein